MGNLLGDMTDITSRAPLKVRRLDDSSVVVDSSAEAITFLYDNNGTLASATGQAAGTYIYAKITHDGILNSFKDKVGDMQDSSFEFVTGTVLTTPLPMEIVQSVDNWKRLTVTEKFAEMAKHMKTNGQYWIDHADGAVWGLAADIVADDTANYSYKTRSGVSGGGGGAGGDVTEQEMPTAEDNPNGVYNVSERATANVNNCWDTDVSTALESSTVSKAAQGRLRSARVGIDSSAASGTYYVQFYNSDVVPADGAVDFLCAPEEIVHVNGAPSVRSFDFTETGLAASNGISMAFSTSQFTKTEAGNVGYSTILYK